jgi:tight adherence protein C
VSVPALTLWRAACWLATALAIFAVTYVAASSPTADARRLGLRGLKRQRALRQSTAWALLEPGVRWLGARLSGLLSEDLRRRLNRQIALAGDFLGLLPEEMLALSLLSACAGCGVGFVLGQVSGLGNMVVMACTLAGAGLPHSRIASAAADRMKDVSRRLPYAIDLLALAMGAGLDFPGSVRQVIEKSGNPEEAVVEEFTLMLQGLKLGRTRRQALEEFAERVPADAVVEFVGSVVQAELRGNPVADVLRIQAEVSRRKRTVRAEELAARAGVAMMLPLVFVFLAILTIIVAPILLRLELAGM